jgi:glycosyltransferase involved in cell wall biosynthesis
MTRAALFPVPEAPARRVAIFADVNPNLIDGSTIWLQSLARAFAGIPGVEATVVLRDPLTSDLVLAPAREAGARLVALGELAPEAAGAGQPARDAGGIAARAAAALMALDARAPQDLFVVRGRSAIEACARRPELAARLWAYWLDRPDIVHPAADPLAEVAPLVQRVVVQSAFAAGLLETVFRVPAEKVLTLPPMVPEEAFAEAGPETFPGTSPQTSPGTFPGAGGAGGPDAPLRLVYSGKIDLSYNVEAYLGLPALLARRGIAAEVTVVGDKFNAAPEDPGFKARMAAALAATPGVSWERGVPRARALALMARGDFGLCWRSPRHDSSLEVSTKLLEFAALGVPPLLNRTAIHARLLGADYPFFVKDEGGIAAAVARGRADPALVAATRARLRETARAFALPAARARIAAALDALPGPPLRSRVGSGWLAAPARGGRAPLKVAVASHDNKFLRRALDALRRDPRFEIREDNWLGLRRNDPAASEACLRWADLVFCEWCAGAAVWYSRRVAPSQSCIVRLHRVELFEDDPRAVDFSRVDRLVVVNDWFAAESARRFGVDPARIDVLPQYVDWAALNRVKHPWAEKTLGLVGINGFHHKRPDRALDVLEALLDRDPAWRLRVRTVMPWDISWIWRRDDERAAFRGLFRRIVDSPRLRDAVLFDPPGPDMAEWYRHIGFILSASDTEGCHTAVAEAMASGAPPAINAWPGAASVYPAEFVCDGAEAMAAKLRALQAGIDAGGGAALRARVAEAARRFELGRTVEHFTRLFLACAEGEKTGRILSAETG